MTANTHPRYINNYDSATATAEPAMNMPLIASAAAQVASYTRDGAYQLAWEWAGRALRAGLVLNQRLGRLAEATRALLSRWDTASMREGWGGPSARHQAEVVDLWDAIFAFTWAPTDEERACARRACLVTAKAAASCWISLRMGQDYRPALQEFRDALGVVYARCRVVEEAGL